MMIVTAAWVILCAGARPAAGNTNNPAANTHAHTHTHTTPITMLSTDDMATTVEWTVDLDTERDAGVFCKHVEVWSSSSSASSPGAGDVYADVGASGRSSGSGSGRADKTCPRWDLRAVVMGDHRRYPSTAPPSPQLLATTAADDQIAPLQIGKRYRFEWSVTAAVSSSSASASTDAGAGADADGDDITGTPSTTTTTDLPPWASWMLSALLYGRNHRPSRPLPPLTPPRYHLVMVCVLPSQADLHVLRRRPLPADEDESAGFVSSSTCSGSDPSSSGHSPADGRDRIVLATSEYFGIIAGSSGSSAPPPPFFPWSVWSARVDDVTPENADGLGKHDNDDEHDEDRCLISLEPPRVPLIDEHGHRFDGEQLLRLLHYSRPPVGDYLHQHHYRYGGRSFPGRGDDGGDDDLNDYPGDHPYPVPDDAPPYLQCPLRHPIRMLMVDRPLQAKRLKRALRAAAAAAAASATTGGATNTPPTRKSLRSSARRPSPSPLPPTPPEHTHLKTAQRYRFSATRYLAKSPDSLACDRRDHHHRRGSGSRRHPRPRPRPSIFSPFVFGSRSGMDGRGNGGGRGGDMNDGLNDDMNDMDHHHHQHHQQHRGLSSFLAVVRSELTMQLLLLVLLQAGLWQSWGLVMALFRPSASAQTNPFPTTTSSSSLSSLSSFSGSRSGSRSSLSADTTTTTRRLMMATLDSTSVRRVVTSLRQLARLLVALLSVRCGIRWVYMAIVEWMQREVRHGHPYWRREHTDRWLGRASPLRTRFPPTPPPTSPATMAAAFVRAHTRVHAMGATSSDTALRRRDEEQQRYWSAKIQALMERA